MKPIARPIAARRRAATGPACSASRVTGLLTGRPPRLGLRLRGTPTVGSMTGMRRRLGEWGLFALLVGPNLLLLAAFTYWPLLYNGYLSLVDWNMLSPEKSWVGTANYRELSADPRFWRI